MSSEVAMWENNLCSPSVVKELLVKYHLTPRKGFGQNFLINSRIPREIAEASLPQGAGEEKNAHPLCALEIGPGLGAMTRELSRLYDRVAAVEIDRGLIPLLGETLAGCDNVCVIHEDFLKLDIPAFLREQFGDSPVHVCANLPYYITTPILMKLLEGADVEVPVGSNQKNAMTPMETVNTDNILFICGGAFPDLENIIRERLTSQAMIGFGADLKDKYEKDPDILTKVTNQDLREFGMIPEFLGRLPVTAVLQGLTKEFLVRILKEPKNAILKQYQKLLEMDEVKLTFDEDALEWIAEEAMKKETGARALRAIIEEFMLDIMFEIPKDPNIGSVSITRAYLEKKGGPRIEMRQSLLIPEI